MAVKDDIDKYDSHTSPLIYTTSMFGMDILIVELALNHSLTLDII